MPAMTISPSDRPGMIGDDLQVCQEVAIFAKDTGQTEMDREFLHITQAEYISGYLLKLTFSNGDVRLFDFSQLYNKGVCRQKP